MTDSYISQKLSSNKGGVEKCIYLRGNHFFIPASCGGTLRGDKIGNLDPTDPRTAHSLSAVYKPTYSLHKKMLRLTIALALVTLVASSQCPNNEVCAAGQSCCQDPTGEFSCCPFHHGECCEDHIHCCPEGMLCNVLDFKCVNATHTLPSVERIPAKQSDFPKSFRMIPSLPASEDDITCPDGSFCPAEFSCLLMASSYGCCPVAQGLVCSDGKHCCPKGHECSADSSSCVKQKEQVETVICGDGKSECPVDTTCCETEDGQWACCPMPKAVCCDDKIHCCPEDSVCDVESSKCMSSTNQELPMWAKFPARLRAEWEDHKPAEMRAEVEVTTTRQITTAGNQMTTLPGALPENSDVRCDETGSCPDGSTCCKTKEGGWACCPLPEAVCCDDFIHCCPHGTTCNVAAGSCDDPSGSTPWFEKLPVQRQNVAVTQVSSDVPCNDTAACPDGSTCCKTKDGGWACCPLPEAVCCEDFTHCCPHGKICNVAAGSCDDPSCSGVPWVKQVPVQPVISQNVTDTKNSDVRCDETGSCPDGSTCCKTKEGGWACCPLPEAVCCDDFIHCCPHGTTCNVAAGSCDDPSGSTPWFEKLPVQRQNVAVTQVSSDVPCNDTAACPDGSTCCKTKEGGWACCPLPEAVCCEDFIHCCPHGKICNDTAGSCDDPSGSTPWLEKLPVQKISSQKVAVTQVSSNVPCDDTTYCPDGSTCCKTKEGGWACCPLPEAVCCDDFIHCCPHGTTCNVAAGSCDDPSGSTPWLEKLPIQRQNVAVTQVSSDVPCDDTKSCPDGSTCCKTKDGGWACCPLPEAVCCDDFIHCCPHGTTCNVAAGSCDDPSGSTPWLEKVPARPRAGQRSTKNVNCDSSHICPESNTCCKNIDGDWGCCPMPEAVCCRDRFHCCPHGTTCNLVTLTCNGNATSVPMSVIISASDKEEQRQHKEVKEEVGKYIRVPCDAHTSCPDYTTCCLIAKTNKWGCCPLPNAVCCTDGEHCCPAYYKCDVSRVSCIKGDVVIPWYNKIAAQSSLTPNSDLNTNKCDEQSSCSTDSTCCRLTTGEWGCCPLPQAVCCPDQQHCCPRGYKCDLRRHSCIKTTWLYVERVPLAHIGGQKPQPNVSGKDIQCGGGYTCQDDQTCCPTSQTTWGCCPSSMAACCDDMKHCCPAGYKCGAGGICTPAVGFDWNNWGSWRVFFSKKKRATTL
ncbi:granulin a isoform X4 [Megalobrama amblycephala]|uniref:granulin a isoform X4 n=1 Tax=Megalobrama amblycephala TaxID=75352 RepID=UPI00201410C4|nr:granulin a isoform X4 [Megalobrama amblycephala]